MRRKSFSLVLLITIIILVILAVVLSIRLINRPEKESDNSNNSSESQDNNSSKVTKFNNLDNSFVDTLETIQSNDQEETNTYFVSLSNHTYKFDKSIQASVEENDSNKVLKVTYPGKEYNIVFSTNKDKTFTELKNTENLKEFIEENYKVTITSPLKSGTLNNLNIIICTISEDTNVAYLVFTPVSDSEIAVAKIYKVTDSTALLEDISAPLSSVSSIISSIE